MHARHLASIAFSLTVLITACHDPLSTIRDPAPLPDRWRTHAERTNYIETGRYAETTRLCQQYADFTPHVHCFSLGRSPAGRELWALALSTEQAFTPRAARQSSRPLVLIENGIHAGEIAGKDACFELLRDMLVTRTRADLLDRINVLILPIFNVDGHERFGPFNRANQHGPREMGWRTTAQNLNLNRDFAKADAPEMQAWLKLWTAWQPDLFIDVHTTNGADHRYDVFYSIPTAPALPTPAARWVDETLLPHVLPAMAKHGHHTLPYSFPRDRTDLTKGINAAVGFSPRYSNGYGTTCNRPSMLVELHAYKSYARRVRACYHLLAEILNAVNKNPHALRTAVRAADAACAKSHGALHDGQVILGIEASETGRQIVYHGYSAHRRPSSITGDDVLQYTREPIDVETTLYDQPEVQTTVQPAAAYLIPPACTEIIKRLGWHGIDMSTLNSTRTLDVASYRFENVTFADRSYEGHQLPNYEPVPIREERKLPAGTVIVPTDQPRARLIAALLEPEARDSFIAWGFCNSIFERKEYAEAHVMEPIARQMLADDPALQAEFERRLAEDPDFAANPGARLEFFYRRSPYFDDRLNVYPIARLDHPHEVERLLQHATPRPPGSGECP